MFFVPPSDSPVTLGDILSECPLVGLNVTEPPSDLRNIEVKRWLARVIDLTQACDLAQHFAVTYMRVALPEPYATQP